MTTTTDTAPATYDDARYMVELLVTDTRCWEVVKRTACTMTLRRMRYTDERIIDERCDPGAWGSRPAWTVMAPDEHGDTFVVRRGKDGTYCGPHGGRTLRPSHLPHSYRDYRD